jgi:cell division septum initiation protein DivIVA
MKKNKNEIMKRQAKARAKVQQKRQTRMAKASARIFERPPISRMDPPKGFIAISSSQALMEYAKPLMEKNAENLDELNRRMELASCLWNLAVSKQKNDQPEYSRWMESAKVNARKVLNLDGAERDRYIAEMIERQIHLFPEEMQPTLPSMCMYMRKEVSYLIPPFDYGRIRFRVDAAVPPDEEDRRLIGKIEELDDHIRRGSEYDAFEALALSIEEESVNLFEKWLIAKGFGDNPEEYAHCPEIYITFLYRYLHDDLVLLKSVPAQYLIEFFEDFLLRKMMCKPSDFLYWPPSLKLFYRFLNEKGYMSSQETDVLLGSLDAMEPHFLELLQERYH